MPTEAHNTTPLGSPAPLFTLPDVVTGKDVSLAEIPAEKGLLVMFICRHCPYVVHVRAPILQLAAKYQPKGIRFLAISSNDAATYPDDAPDKLREMAVEHSFPFPMLYDETQEVARAYDAQCTPDFFLYDAERKLAYRGRLDDSTPGNGKPQTSLDILAALEAVLAGQPVEKQTLSLGCSIKWKKA